jgi:hypothetical protein
MKTCLTILLVFLTLPCHPVILLPPGVPLRTYTFQSQSVAAYEREQPKPQPDSALCVMAVVVLVIGGVACYVLIKFCKAHFPPPPLPDSPPTNSANPGTNAPGTNVVAVVWGPQPGQAIWQPTQDPANQCTFIVNYVLSDTSATMVPCSFWGEDQGITLSDAQNLLQSHYGVILSGDPGLQIATNGIPTTNCPLSFTYTNGVLAVLDGTPTRTAVLERLMPDGWSPVLTNIWGSTITNCTVEDVNAPFGTCFYRVKLVR